MNDVQTMKVLDTGEDLVEVAFGLKFGDSYSVLDELFKSTVGTEFHR
jgi:hypothetical protein